MVLKNTQVVVHCMRIINNDQLICYHEANVLSIAYTFHKNNLIFDMKIKENCESEIIYNNTRSQQILQFDEKIVFFEWIRKIFVLCIHRTIMTYSNNFQTLTRIIGLHKQLKRKVKKKYIIYIEKKDTNVYRMFQNALGDKNYYERNTWML